MLFAAVVSQRQRHADAKDPNNAYAAREAGPTDDALDDMDYASHFGPTMEEMLEADDAVDAESEANEDDDKGGEEGRRKREERLAREEAKARTFFSPSKKVRALPSGS